MLRTLLSLLLVTYPRGSSSGSEEEREGGHLERFWKATSTSPRGGLHSSNPIAGNLTPRRVLLRLRRRPGVARRSACAGLAFAPAQTLRMCASEEH